MRRLAGLLMLVLAQGLAGCSSGQLPTAPTLTESPAAVPPAPDPAVVLRWNLTSTLKSMNGPELCLSSWAEDVGESFDWLLETRRTDDHAIQLVYDVGNPEVNENYAGTVVVNEFSAASAPSPGALLCNGQRLDFTAEGHVSGHFSEDGRELSAEELYSLRLTSGETLNFRYEWRATRR